jgi:glycosyltransferase involved in cell wall biosynthesis
MAEPKLAVCVPVYNGEKSIGRLLDSLTKQTFKDIKILVSDNDSTDNTGRICRNMAARDSRIVYSRNPSNMGLVYNYCHLYFAHSSPYSAYAAHDLVWKPEFAEKCIQTLEANPDALVAYPACEFINDNGEPQEVYFDRVSFADPDPGARFLNIINHLGWNTPYLGIFRHFETVSLYMRLSLMSSEEFANDNLYMAGVALKGKIMQVPFPLLQRKKGSHQDGSARISFSQRHNRVDVLADRPEGLGIRLPVVNFIKTHCMAVACSDLPMERKSELVNETIQALKSRYKGFIEFELSRAIRLIGETQFRAGWEDDIKQMNNQAVNKAKYQHLDFSYIIKLISEFEYATTLFPDFPLIHFGRAVLYNAVARNREAQLALVAQLERTPNHQQSRHFLHMLTRKVA